MAVAPVPATSASTSEAERGHEPTKTRPGRISSQLSVQRQASEEPAPPPDSCQRFLLASSSASVAGVAGVEAEEEERATAVLLSQAGAGVEVEEEEERHRRWAMVMPANEEEEDTVFDALAVAAAAPPARAPCRVVQCDTRMTLVRFS